MAEAVAADFTRNGISSLTRLGSSCAHLDGIPVLLAAIPLKHLLDA